MPAATAAKAAPAGAPSPGQVFRWPGTGVQPRIVQESGPGPYGVSTPLQQTSQVVAPFSKFQQLDIVQSYLLELDFSTTYTAAGGTPGVTASPLFPLNLIQNVQVQFESAYNTFRLPGVLAFIMQSYRSVFGPGLNGAADDAAAANVLPVASQGAALYSAYTAAPPLSTPNLAVTTAGVAQNYRLFLEIPVSMVFDVYWDLAVNGVIQGAPQYRAIVSPQYMAATTRNVTPQVTYSPLLGALNSLAFPVSTPAGGTSTATGSVVQSWYRDAFIPGTNPATSPPVFGWQYSRDYLTTQPNQAQIVPITLDQTVVGQGQILSLVFYTWDPTLNGGYGGITPITSYLTVELLYGSTVQLRQQAPQENLYEWMALHGKLLPAGVMGWDLALTRDQRLTNEFALNSLVQAGAQVRITYAVGFIPAAAATVYMGLETLRKVGV
jgi:hypothetical protein